MINLKLIENQPHWRVALVHLFARLIGVLAHVEGIPFGSNRISKRARSRRGDLVTAQSGALGSFVWASTDDGELFSFGDQVYRSGGPV